MDPREYDWQIGDLADQGNYPPGVDPSAIGTAVKNWWSSQPSWAERAKAENQRTAEAFQRGGMGEIARQLATDTTEAQDLASAFGAGTLAGPRSLTANLGKYKTAQEMLQYGKTAPEIRKETNWFPIDKRGNLAYEIPDRGTGWIDDPSTIPRGHLPASAPAEAIYRHPAAYEAYPDLGKIPVIIDKNLGKGVRGGFDPPEYVGDQPKVYITPASSKQMRSVLGHELLGHGVQNLEQGQTPAGKLTGWSIGGNPNLFLKEIAREGTPQHEIYQRLRSSASKPISFEEYADMLKGTGLEATEKSYNNFLEATNKFGISGPVDDRLRQLAAHETYRKGAGEAAARAIQARMDFGSRKIQQVPFEQSFDVPLNEQLFVPRPPLKTRLGTDPSIPDPEKFGMSMGSLADHGNVQLSAKAPTGFVLGSLMGTGKTLASPKEITRAAAESRKGMTQPELRELYDQLGLTGRAPSELVSKSLAAKQPTSLVEEATRIKLADREVLDTLTGQQRLDYQKTGKLPGGVLLPSQEAALPGLEKFAPVKKEVARAEKEFDKAGSRVGDLFDLSPKTLMKTPNVPQYPLPRVAPKVTERLEPVAKGGLARLERAAAAAPEENWGWYNLMQQRDLMHQLHGPQKGEQAFNAWLDGLAGTSMVNPIDNNIRSSTWYLQQVLQGKPLPEVLHIADPETGKMVKTMAGGPPPGYGAKSQIQHADRVREYMTHTYDPVTNPKPISYRTNLSGNYGPRTVDTHDIRNMVGMPLAKKLFSAEDSALLPGEYSHLEDVGARAAKRAGTAQAPQQAATWVGGGEYTGLKSYPAPLAEAINRRAHITAKVRGITPEQALEDAFTGKMPLLGIGGGAVMGGLATQNDYQQ